MKKILATFLVMAGLFTAAPAYASPGHPRADVDQFLTDLRASGFNISKDGEQLATLYGLAVCVDLSNGASVDEVLADLGEKLPAKLSNVMLYMAIKDLCPRMKV